ncbi:MAG: hypothetical protein AABY11_00205 [archaeon]
MPAKKALSRKRPSFVPEKSAYANYKGVNLEEVVIGIEKNIASVAGRFSFNMHDLESKDDLQQYLTIEALTMGRQLVDRGISGEIDLRKIITSKLKQRCVDYYRSHGIRKSRAKRTKGQYRDRIRTFGEMGLEEHRLLDSSWDNASREMDARDQVDHLLRKLSERFSQRDIAITMHYLANRHSAERIGKKFKLSPTRVLQIVESVRSFFPKLKE